MNLTTSFLSILCFLWLYSVNGQNLGKSTAWTYLTDSMDLSGGALTKTDFTIWQKSTDPRGCYDVTDECARRGGSWSSSNVTYNDTPNQEIQICSCTGAPWDVNTLAGMYGQVPAFLRKAWSVAIVNDQYQAYTQDKHIMLMNTRGAGQVQEINKWQDGFVHESTHAYDDGFSDSQAWINAINQDSCVPDAYSNTNRQEDFAQSMVVFVYRMLNSTTSIPDCMKWQQGAILNLQRQDIQGFIQAHSAPGTTPPTPAPAPAPAPSPAPTPAPIPNPTPGPIYSNYYQPVPPSPQSPSLRPPASPAPVNPNPPTPPTNPPPFTPTNPGPSTPNPPPNPQPAPASPQQQWQPQRWFPFQQWYGQTGGMFGGPQQQNQQRPQQGGGQFQGGGPFQGGGYYQQGGSNQGGFMGGFPMFGRKLI